MRISVVLLYAILIITHHFVFQSIFIYIYVALCYINFCKWYKKQMYGYKKQIINSTPEFVHMTNTDGYGDEMTYIFFLS